MANAQFEKTDRNLYNSLNKRTKNAEYFIETPVIRRFFFYCIDNTTDRMKLLLLIGSFVLPKRIDT
jgi:hypothetical protein